jgi:hypothetical protein
MIFSLKPAHTGLSSHILGMLSSPSTVAALRGGASSSVVLQDFSGPVAEYFSGIRTPASLILGASLGALFVTNLTDNMRANSRTERLVTRFYNTCVLFSFLLSFCCTVTATAAGVTLLHHSGLGKAETAYALLMRDFEFEFITVRLSYLASLLSFVIGITSRILLEYKLLDKDRREEALVVCFSIGAVITHLWSYINSTLYSSQSLFRLAFTLFQIILRRAFLEHRPLQVVSLACSTLAAFFLVKVVFFKKKGNSKDVIL